MNKIFSTNFLIIAVALFIILIPESIFASELTFKLIPNADKTDKTTIIEVRINPQSKNINVVEGIINFEGIVSDKLSVNIETGGSVLTLWPTPPQYISSQRNITFVGGVPKGFNKEGLLFRMRILSALQGQVVISLIQAKSYLNDGKGTEEPVLAKATTINLESQNINTISKSSFDNTPPYFDTTEIGRDPNVYSGKYFISFHANDDISGISRYEVNEGPTMTSVIDGVYVFIDQERKTPITITAYDKADNSKTIEIKPRFNLSKNVTILIILLFIIIFFSAVLYGYKKIIKK